jgi:hypothetical protein
LRLGAALRRLDAFHRVAQERFAAQRQLEELGERRRPGVEAQPFALQPELEAEDARRPASVLGDDRLIDTRRARRQMVARQTADGSPSDGYAFGRR